MTKNQQTSTTKLANNARLHYVRVSGAKTVETRLFFKAGFQYFDKDNQHIPHLLEHLLLANGGTLGSGEALDEALQNMGAHANASTDYETLTVYLNAPREHNIDALKLVINSVFYGRITQELLDSEREIVIREIYDQYDTLPNQITCSLFAKVLPDTVPEDWRHYIETTKGFKLDQIVKAYNAYVISSNTQALIAGDLSEVTIADTKKILQTIKTGPVFTPRQIARLSPIDEPEIFPFIIDSDEVATITLTFTSPIIANETARDRAAYNLLTAMLFDGPSPLVAGALRKKGLVYSVDFDLVVTQSAQILVVHASTEGPKIHDLTLELISHLASAAKGGISEARLARVKQFVATMLATSDDTVSDTVDWYSRDIVHERPLTPPEEEAKIIDSVSVEDIVRAAQTLFLQAQLYGVVVATDAPHWSEKLASIWKQSIETKTSDEINSLYASSKLEVEQLRLAAPERVGYGWVLYYCFATVTWLAAVFVTHLVLPESGQKVALLDYSWDVNVLWGIIFYVPFTLATIAMGVRGAKEKIAERFTITANFVAAMAYAYGAFYLFDGAIGSVAGRSILENVAALAFGLYFFVACPIAMVSLVALMLRRRQNIRRLTGQ